MIEAETANMLSQWVRNNLDIVFFIYGFAFVVMGIAILVQPKKGSEFPLANILWLLAGFGITHGINEFLDMWAIIKGRHSALDLIRWFILVASYVFMFEFGRRLLNIHLQISHQWHRKIAKLLVWWLSPLIGVFILVSGFMSSDFWKAGSIWTRYLLGFPGGLLVGSGFLLCSCHEIATKLKVRKYFWTGGVSFLIYGIVGGLVVPKGDFFPASHLNTELFITTVKIPVQVFRTIFAVIAAWAVSGMLRIFNWEIREKLRENQKCLENQLNENIRLTGNLSSLHEISKEILTEFDVERLLKKIAGNARRLIGCRYAAIGIMHEEGGYKYYVTSGIDQKKVEYMKKVTGYPAGKGILGYLSGSGKPVRIDDISRHPSAAGFPEGHPKMTTFLGVPVILHDKVEGRIYFTDKLPAEGSAAGKFTEEDETLAISFAATVSLAINNTNILKDIEKLASFPQKSPYPVIEFDTDCNITYLNPAAQELINRFNIRGLDLLPADVYEIAAGLDVSGKEITYCEVRFRGDIFGEYIHLLPDGKAIRVYVFDITEHERAKDEIEKSYQTQKALNSLLHVSLEDKPLNEQMQSCLDIILSVPFVRLLPKGGIFLVENGSRVLELVANRGLPVPLIGICSRVPFGRCLCGRAAESRRIQFAGCVDDRHDNRYDGLNPHGHYNVPILSKGKVLGVFVLYLQEGHQQKEDEIIFLQTVADTLAGIIERKEVEDELKRYSRELMQLAESSNVIGAIAPSEDIYEAICNIAVRNFDLKMAWIGLIEDGSYYVKPLAQSGFEEGYLSDVIIKWDDSPEGMGPTGMAVKTRIPQAMQNIDTDPAYAPWRDKALKKGYKSSLAIPLINSDAKMFGVLNLYSSEPRFFTKKTERLFITFANHALSAIENRQLIEGLEEKVKERTKEIEETHSELKKLFNAVEQSGEAVVVTDAYGIIEYVNPAFCTISGYSREEALGRNPKILNSGKNPPGLFRDMWNTILSGKIWRGTVINRKKTGDLYHEEMTVAPVIDSYGEITNFIAVKNDVTDKLMAQEELRKKNIELDEARMQAESANRAKSDFLSNMSHEMRTPLGAIIGFSEMMKEGFAGEINAQQSEYLGNVINASNQLLSLINDLLDLAKIESGKMELELKEFNLGEMLETNLAMFKDKALKHNLKLGLELGEGTEKVTADAAKIRQIMLNLLGNAVKFTPEGGAVSVQARLIPSTSNRNFIEITIADTGIGISEEDREKLFQPFQQLDSVLTKKYKGTGLGLSICKRLIELHGGKIWIEGLEGGGSRFSFVIPANRVEKHHSGVDGVRKT